MPQTLPCIFGIDAVSRIVAYTDGGCRGNPGLGAWAFVLIDTETHQALECANAVLDTTNNQMELTAVIEALSALRRPQQRVVVMSDSKYVINCGAKWIAGWKRQHWHRKGGPLKNVDLLRRLDGLANSHDLEWKWVRGHAGDVGNERADALANQAMDRLTAGGTTRWERRFPWKGRLP
jgi:ribonuclease HI